MNKSTLIVGILAVGIVVAGIYASKLNKSDSMINDKAEDTAMTQSGDQAMIEKDVAKDTNAMMQQSKDTMMKAGSYESYAPEKVALASTTHHVILFFRASWCPTCRVVDADIKANLSKIPENLTILDVDYDNSTALKQKYGVTYQHTFVQVDASGTLIKKWSASPTLAAIVSQVK